MSDECVRTSIRAQENMPSQSRAVNNAPGGGGAGGSGLMRRTSVLAEQQTTVVVNASKGELFTAAQGFKLLSRRLKGQFKIVPCVCPL